jgi:hypothetical protein
MAQESTTYRAKYSFEVKAYEDGKTPWIMLEPLREGVPVLTRGFLGFDLPSGTTEEQAYAIAEYLNEKIEWVTYTE